MILLGNCFLSLVPRSLTCFLSPLSPQICDAGRREGEEGSQGRCEAGQVAREEQTHPTRSPATTVAMPTVAMLVVMPIVAMPTVAHQLESVAME